MIHVTTKKRKIAKGFLNDIAQGDWAIRLDKSDFYETCNQHKPIIAVRAEDDKSIAELTAIALDEIRKAGCKPMCFIVMLSFRHDDELMMQEFAAFNDCFSAFIDENTELKWGVQSLTDMPCKRRITIIAFAQAQRSQRKCLWLQGLWKKLTRRQTLCNMAKMMSRLLLFICLDFITFVGFIYFERNHIYRCGVWWEKIEAFVQK